jgi:hypothetical protein
MKKWIIFGLLLNESRLIKKSIRNLIDSPNYDILIVKNLIKDNCSNDNTDFISRIDLLDNDDDGKFK